MGTERCPDTAKGQIQGLVCREANAPCRGSKTLPIDANEVSQVNPVQTLVDWF